LLGCHPHPLMKRSAPIIDMPDAKRSRDDDLDAKRSASLVDATGYNWNDLFRFMLSGGHACPHDRAFDGFIDLWCIYDKNFKKPEACWCRVTEDYIEALEGVKKFYFPHEFRCKQIWRTAVMFKRTWQPSARGTSSMAHELDDGIWIDYTSSRRVCHDYWKPMNLVDVNKLNGCKITHLPTNPWFDEINKKNYEIEF